MVRRWWRLRGWDFFECPRLALIVLVSWCSPVFATDGRDGCLLVSLLGGVIRCCMGGGVCEVGAFLSALVRL